MMHFATQFARIAFVVVFVVVPVFASGAAWLYEGVVSTVNPNDGFYPSAPGQVGIPPARTNAGSWIDTNGTLWFFGGLGYNGFYGDLWKYTQGNWIWMGGSVSTLVSYTENIIGSRVPAASWSDSQGNGYIFGGENEIGGTQYYYNDVWKFTVSTAQWSFIAGTSSPYSPGVFPGSAGEAGIPPATHFCTFWTDPFGQVWTYGGEISTGDNSNDLSFSYSMWKYVISTNTWFWIGNSCNPPSYPSVIGQEGCPPFRLNALTWNDAAGNLWFFGGFAQGTELNDFWKYVPTRPGVWYYEGGYPGIGGPANYTSTTQPGPRYFGQSWTDRFGAFWLYGGLGTVSSSGGYSEATIGDFWKYNALAGNWDSQGGGYLEPLVYPSAVGGAGNPGNRFGAATWVDGSGNFWLFGGYGDEGYMNDIWVYNVSSTPPLPSSTSTTVFAASSSSTTAHTATTAEATSTSSSTHSVALTTSSVKATTSSSTHAVALSTSSVKAASSSSTHAATSSTTAAAVQGTVTLTTSATSTKATTSTVLEGTVVTATTTSTKATSSSTAGVSSSTATEIGSSSTTHNAAVTTSTVKATSTSSTHSVAASTSTVKASSLAATTASKATSTTA